MKWTDNPKVPMKQGAWIQNLIEEFPDITIVKYAIDGTKVGIMDKVGNKVLYKFDGTNLIPLGMISKNIKGRGKKKV